MNTRSVPTYNRQRRKKSTDLAYVEFSGKRFYLGEYDSKASKREYHRLVAEWLANDRNTPVDPREITVVELAARFLRHAGRYYRRPDGTASSEVGNFKRILRLMVDLYGDLPASAFGPRALKALRQKLVDRRICRRSVNMAVGRVKRVFKWGVSEELVSPTVIHGLRSVDGLRRGRSGAKESKPVKPAPDAHIKVVRPHVSRQVWALIQLQLLTGARSGEVLIMRAVDLDTTGRIWTYTPREHKTAYHEHERTIYLGPKAQKALKPFLKDRPLDAYLFSPTEAEAERRAAKHKTRKIPLSTGNRPGTNRKPTPARPPRERYDVSSYNRAINRACRTAKKSPWHPHQLRHNAATYLRKEFGLDAARIILGHRSPAITEVYAELDRDKAIEVMEQYG